LLVRINNDGGTFHCFGCNESGDAIDVFTKHLQLPFYKAIEKLCSYSGYDLEALMKDMAQIDKARSTAIKVSSLPLTNQLFNRLTNYNPFRINNEHSEISLPNSFVEMSSRLNSLNYLTDSGNGTELVNLINDSSTIKRIATENKTLKDGKLTFYANTNYLPVMTISKPDNSSSLPIIVSENSSDKQFHCSGFLVLDENLDLMDTYPNDAVESHNSILIPPPSQVDMFENVDEIYITESSSQYIELVSSNVTNVTAPAAGELNHQHLRQMSNLPTKNLTWVTTQKFIANPRLLSKLAIFTETIGSNKQLNIVMLKDNQDNNAFSSLVMNNPKTAFNTINSKKLPVGDVVKMALPTISLLTGTQYDFAIRSSALFAKKMLCSENEKTQATAIDIINKLINITAKPKHEIYSLVCGVGSSTMKKCISEIDTFDVSTHKVPSIIDTGKTFDSMDRDIKMMMAKIKATLTGNENDPFYEIETKSVKLQLAESLLFVHAIENISHSQNLSPEALQNNPTK
ncbi:CHC2 zinc finger domain-containing protein, partial [Vibrio sp. 10N.222.49.F1]|uniref:CHC2 zinc finger domain-containing protein n=1 Tax=Vibrio sp. 10N.222.49.F1 TaxID=3229618 RepID=UPI00354E821B